MRKLLLPVVASALLFAACSGSQSSTATNVPSSSSSSTSVASSLPFDGTILSGMHTVILHTTMGDITLALNADSAPKTVTNFIALAKAGYYDHLTFHRVIPDFMIQGGDPSGDGTGGSSVYGPTFDDEINAKSYGLDTQKMSDAAKGQALPPDIAGLTVKEYLERTGYVYNDKLKSLPMVKGAIAMANRGPNTNGSQFFIIQAASTPWLNGRHTVFGNVTKGLDVVDKIVNVPRDPNDKPLQPVTYTVEVVN